MRKRAPLRPSARREGESGGKKALPSSEGGHARRERRREGKDLLLAPCRRKGGGNQQGGGKEHARPSFRKKETVYMRRRRVSDRTRGEKDHSDRKEKTLQTKKEIFVLYLSSNLSRAGDTHALAGERPLLSHRENREDRKELRLFPTQTGNETKSPKKRKKGPGKSRVGEATGEKVLSAEAGRVWEEVQL